MFFHLNVAGKLGRFGEIAVLGTRLSVLGMRQGVIGFAVSLGWGNEPLDRQVKMFHRSAGGILS